MTRRIGTRPGAGAWIAATMVTAIMLAPTPGPRVVLRAAEQQSPADAALTARAREVVERLASGDVAPIVPMLDDTMKAAIDEARLRAIFPAVIVQAGAYKGLEGIRTELRGPNRVVFVTCAFERNQVDVAVAFDGSGRITGLRLFPVVAPAASYSPPSYVDPAAFRDEPITVDAGGWPLPGTLTVPVGAGPFPAIVLVHGSGPSDRDATAGGSRVFRDLAEGLATQGIAVLRYDKRTRVHAARIAALTSFTSKEEVVDDAVAAVRLLRSRKEIRADRVFVLGHSFGGMMAPRIAAAGPGVAGLVILAGNVRSLEQAILDQTRYLANLDGAVSADEQSQIDAAVKLVADARTLKASDPPLGVGAVSAPASYWLDLRGYDPAAAAATLTQPVLVLQGERDYQVTMADDFAAWRRALGARPNAQLKSYPLLNHRMIAGAGPSQPAEYLAPGHVDVEVVRDIAAWIKAR